MAAKILVVDDDPAISEMLTIVLQGEGFDTVVVGDGQEAVVAAREHNPDLILLDLNLPKMDGREVLEALKGDEALRRIPVVVLTTSEAEEDVVRSYSLHANAYVTKPVDFDRFIEVVRQIDEFFVEVVRLPQR